MPRSLRTRTLPSSSRATVTVSRAKKSAPRTVPDGLRRSSAAAVADLAARVSPAALVGVELLVRLLVHRLPVHPRLPCGDADAELDAHGQLGRAIEVLQAVPHARRNLGRVVLVGIRHGDPELVTSEPAARVGRAHRALQLMGQNTDRFVADVVPVLV